MGVVSSKRGFNPEEGEKAADESLRRIGCNLRRGIILVEGKED